MYAAAAALVAGAAFGAPPAVAAQKATYKFDGPVVFVKDSRGYVGAIFRLNRTLPRRSDGGSAGLASLNGQINARSLDRVSGRCYTSILNFAPQWGRFGNRYSLKLELANGQTITRSGVLYKASSRYLINESRGLSRDPKVLRRLDC